MTDLPLLCKECRFCLPDRNYRWPKWGHILPIVGWLGFFSDRSDRDNSWNYAKCTKSVREVGNIDLITGKVIPDNYHYCSTARKFDTLCGPDAKLFEPKS